MVAFLLAWCFDISSASATGKNLPIPRFVSIRSNEVNARVGPGVAYPAKWVFIKKGEPVEVIAEFEQWRKIRDINGDDGWVHSSMLSGKRSIIVTSKTPLDMHYRALEKSTVIAKLGEGLRCSLKKCAKKWCKLDCRSKKGWIKQEQIWGIYPSEDKVG